MMDIYLGALFAIIFIYLLNYLLFKNKNYWKNKNVPYVEPLPIFGNYKEYLLVKKHPMKVAQEICQKFPDEPCIGSFYGTDPALIIQDPKLLKAVLTKDFYFCNGREASDYFEKEDMMKNIFFASDDYWKVLRMNLTPLFSSGKLKSMFYLIRNCADILEQLLEDEVKTDSEPDKRRIFAKYTMECIMSCAFGVKADTMKKSETVNVFTAIGDSIFIKSYFRTVKNITRAMWPSIFYGLRQKMIRDDIDNFFTNLLSGVIKSREGATSLKHDFVDLILTWKNHKYITGDSFNNLNSGDNKTFNIEMNEKLLVAQCWLIFAAGFETTATSTTFILYELAKNQDAQNKVIKEVDKYFQKNKDIEYECINSLPYTEMCIQESLRLYPVLGLIMREVRYDYTLPTGLLLKKGTRIHIPLYHIQHNPKYFSEPEKYIPERFSADEKKKIIPYSYMPFGEGPRNCIGMRFAKMPMYAALLKVFKNYRVELADGMPEKIDFNPGSFVTQSLERIRIKFIPRKI